MELHYYWVWMSVMTLLASLYKIVSKLNGWYYDHKVGEKKHLLPPGDMGWPIIGNMFQFMKDFLFTRQPDSFLHKLISKHGEGGMYRTHLFLRPTIMVTRPELCRRVLTDDVNFEPGYPISIDKLTPSILSEITTEEHRRFRRLVTLPIVGFNTLGMYIERLEDTMKNSLQKMAMESEDHPVEVLTHMKYCALKSILDMFIGSYNQKLSNTIASLFLSVYDAAFTFPAVRFPGFAFHKAIKSRKKLEELVQRIVEERREMMRRGEMREKKDLMNILLEIRDDITGRKVENHEIVNTLLMFLFSGHETTAVIMQLATIYLVRNPHVWKKAKEEQEQIVKEKPPSQTHLTLEDIKKMNYLNMVIYETLRKTLTFAGFRRALVDIEINGYIIPKGWIVLVWGRGSHMNPEHFSNPDDFNPSRWNDYKTTSRTFIPFGAGLRLCPGRDLAKLEVRIFLHHFLLNYKLELVNPDCPVSNFPAAFAPRDNCLARVIKVSDT